MLRVHCCRNRTETNAPPSVSRVAPTSPVLSCASVCDLSSCRPSAVQCVLELGHRGLCVSTSWLAPFCGVCPAETICLVRATRDSLRVRACPGTVCTMCHCRRNACSRQCNSHIGCIWLCTPCVSVGNVDHVPAPLHDLRAARWSMMCPVCWCVTLHTGYRTRNCCR